MSEVIVTVKYFACRKEGGKWRYWGWGEVCGEPHTFWMLTRKHGFTFKPFNTYSHARLIEEKVQEQQGKGYASTVLTPYFQKKLDRCYGVSMIAGTLHVGRRRGECRV